MKKTFCCIFCILMLLTGCTSVKPFGDSTTSPVTISDGYLFGETTTRPYGLLSCDNNGGSENDGNEANGLFDGKEMRGVWLSYYEINVTSERDTAEEYTAYLESLCQGFAPFGITDVFAHVRAYGDAIYPSEFFPSSKYCASVQGGELPFDCLELICKVMNSNGIRVHAWINPYRVHSTSDISQLSDDNRAKQWYSPTSNADVAIVGEKIYYNPCSKKAQKLVVDGVNEILDKYAVAGIHIDDYFYPPECNDFDSAEYEAYLLSGGSLEIDDWRRNNVSCLVSEIYRAVKSHGEQKIFSISPAGNIENNYEKLYADVELWCKGGYADLIIPQIYFGFEHSSKPFAECTDDWLSLKGDSVSMAVGLALYKSGKEDEYAGQGETEWINKTDILARQVQYLRSRACDGFAIFSVEYFIGDGTSACSELENLKSVL